MASIRYSSIVEPTCWVVVEWCVAPLVLGVSLGAGIDLVSAAVSR